MRKVVIAIAVAMLAILACRMSPSEPRQLGLYPSPTVEVTQTPVVVYETVVAQQTVEVPVVVEITPTSSGATACVSANVAVYLRPSASDDNYPIMPLPNGEQLTDLGGRSGAWWFVQYGDKQGWVNSTYLGGCK